MKTIASFQLPEQAHLVRSRLEASGITAFLRDELTIGSDWALTNALGGIRLQVADEDYEPALELLRAFEKAADLDQAPGE